jgi:kynurenine formamidase
MTRTQADLDHLAARFTSGTLPSSEWTHESHLVVGLWHVRQFGADVALDRLRAGIRRLNESHGTPNSDTRGYHETITRAYVVLLTEWLRRAPGDTSLQECATSLLMSPVADKDALLRFYSRERLLSLDARTTWLEPDLGPLRTTGVLIDVSHTVEHGMVTYKGLPAPVMCDFLSREASRGRYAPGTEFQIDRIDMVGNTGTYIDSPFHRYPNGKDLSELPLASLANLECLVARVESGSGRAIDQLPFTPEEVCGRAVLVHTGWDRHWRTDQYFEGHPHLTASLASWLADAKAALVGIDSFNIDCIDTGERPVHSILLGHDIPIVEHLCRLRLLPDRGSRFFAVPVKVARFGTFPVRAFAIA